MHITLSGGTTHLNCKLGAPTAAAAVWRSNTARNKHLPGRKNDGSHARAHRRRRQWRRKNGGTGGDDSDPPYPPTFLASTVGAAAAAARGTTLWGGWAQTCTPWTARHESQARTGGREGEVTSAEPLTKGADESTTAPSICPPLSPPSVELELAHLVHQSDRGADSPSAAGEVRPWWKGGEGIGSLMRTG